MLLLLVVACQAKAREVSDPPPAPIEVRDGSGAVLATVRPGHPCRGTIGGTELQVGSAPLVAEVGDLKWTGQARPNGTMLLRGDVEMSRVVDQGSALDLYDPQGIPIVRIASTAAGATVADRASRLVRHATLKPASIAIDTPPLAITGTRDAVVAALLSAPEVLPEVRVLATCEHLAKGTATR